MLTSKAAYGSSPVEGYVGSAVNIAARVCAKAAPGEVLVTDTVRSLTRSRLAVRFLPRGTPRLKGIEEPIALFAVSAAQDRAATAPPAARVTLARRSVPRAAVAIVLVGILAIGGSLAALSALGPSTTPAPSLVAVASTASAATASLSAAPTAAAFPTVAETLLLQTLPADLRATCVRGRGQLDLLAAGFSGTYRPDPEHAVPPQIYEASLTCTPVGVGAPTGLWFLSYPVMSKAFADEAVAFIEFKYGAPEGDCGRPPARGSWRSSLGASGSITCLSNTGPGGQPWLYWTFGSSHGLAIATAPVGQYQALYSWFQRLTPFLN
jgi:hypothetical protein